MKDSEAMDKLREFYDPEELHPNLGPYVYTTRTGLTMLNHPLVQQPFMAPHLNKQANKMYAYKLGAVAQAILDKNWELFVFLHERPYRAKALSRIMKKVPDEEYWPLLRSVWIDTENLWQWGPLVRRLLLADKSHRSRLMYEHEQVHIQRLPEVAPLIFRGYSLPGKARGWSWTFDRDKAEWFARRFATKTADLAIGEVYRKDIVAYITGRDEEEVIVDPHNVRVLETQIVSKREDE